MSNLGNMKSNLAAEMRRSGLAADIAIAISGAINHYQNKQFAFNVTDGLAFSTVSGQGLYSKADDADIPKFYRIDGVWLNSSGQVTELKHSSLALNDVKMAGSNVGKPSDYGRYGRSIVLYPIPNAVYTVSLAGHYKIDKPANDAEENNPWMVEAEAMIRYRAKAILYSDVLRNDAEAAKAMGREKEAYDALKEEQDQTSGTGFLVPTEF